jgi:hypothetical protein
MESWRNKMDDLESGRGFTPTATWEPLPAVDRRDAPAVVVDSGAVICRDRYVKENVPRVLTEQWSAADRKRAEVSIMCHTKRPHAQCGRKL